MPEHFRQDATEGLPEDVAEEAQENRFKGQGLGNAGLQGATYALLKKICL